MKAHPAGPAADRRSFSARPSAPMAANRFLFLTSRWAVALSAGVLVLLTVLVYANSFAGAFAFDDESWIVTNSAIHHFWPVRAWLLPSAANASSGRPVIALTLAINYALGGTNVWGYHAVNLAIHLLAALLLFGVVRRTLTLPRAGPICRMGLGARRPSSNNFHFRQGDSPIFVERKLGQSPTCFSTAARDEGRREKDEECSPSALNGPFALAATPLALAVALLWAVHPLQTQAVTYLIQRCESLVSLFYLLTLYCVIRGAESQKGTVPFWRHPIAKIGTVPWLWNAAAVVACLLGAGAKEVIATCPLVVLLYDRTFLSGSFRGALKARYGLYLALTASWAAVLGLLISTGFYGGTTGFAVKSFTWWSYLFTQSGVLVHYLRLAFWPSGLCLDYDWPPATTLAAIVPPSLVIVGLLGLTVWALVRRPAAGFLGASFFLVLAPTSSIVPIADAAYDHRMYLPLAAVATGLVTAVYAAGRRAVDRGVVSRRPAQIAGVCLTALAATALGICTFQRNAIYGNDLSIVQDEVANAPGNARAHVNLAAELLAVGRAEDAVAECRKALKLKPDSATAYNNLGQAYMKLNRREEAIREYREALRIDPDESVANYNLGVTLIDAGRTDEAVSHFQKAVDANPNFAEAQNSLANALRTLNRPDEAIDHCRKALQSKPDYLAAYNNLGNLLTQRGRFEEAIDLYQKAMAVNPHYTLARRNLVAAYYAFGDALVGRSRFGEAAAQYRNALALQPDFAPACNRLARLLATCSDASVRNGPEAVALGQQAVELSSGQDPIALDTLAAAYAEAKHFSEAVQTARQALELATEQQKLAAAEAIRAKLQLYEAGKPFRPPPQPPANK